MIGQWQLLPLVVILFLSFSLITAIINHLSVRRLDQFPPLRDFPRISVLVPARNEESNIEACVTSILAQDFPDFEVLVLDDHSKDGTLGILTRLAARDSRLRVLEGDPLPEGWLGKHWACHQLAQKAAGDLFLFTDADTRHEPGMLRDSVSALAAQGADLVTAFPYEEVNSWSARLIVPVISFGIFSFLPIYLVRLLKWPALSVTIGQFMLFKASTFKAIGGYEAVRSQVVDDVALGRLILEQGYQWRLLDGTNHVSCRMYHNFTEAVEGFSKNAFAFFDYRILPFLSVLVLITVAFILPPFALLGGLIGMPSRLFPPNLASIAVFESLLLWWIAYRRFKLPAYLITFYPLSLALILLIALRSLLLVMTGTSTWKDRKLDRVPMRWI